MYLFLKELPEYNGLRNAAMITGIWDDHDYGINSGNKHFIHKDKSKELYLEFLEEERTNPGIFYSYTFGDETDRTVKLILLDNRYFSDDKDDINGDGIGDLQ